MDTGALITRTWHISRRYTWLWILGLLVVGLGSGNVDLTLPTAFNISEGDPAAAYTTTSMMGVMFLTGVLALFGVALWVVGAIARGGLIVAVDRISRDEPVTLVDAWNGGVRYFGRVFLIGVPVAIPALLLTFITYAGALPGMTWQPDGTGVLLDVVTLCLMPLCGVLVIMSLLLTLVQLFADRAAILEDLGPLDAIARGWEVLQANRRDLLTLGGLWALLTALVRLLLLVPTSGVILPVLFFSVAGVAVSPVSLPMLCLATFLTALAFVLYALCSVWMSAIWTLVYHACLAPEPAQFDSNDDAATGTAAVQPSDPPGDAR
jgi:hypothetical protein